MNANWRKPTETILYPAMSVSRGILYEFKDICLLEETRRGLMRRRTSCRDASCLRGTHTGNRYIKCQRVCLWVCESVYRQLPQECATTETVIMGTIPPVAQGYQTMGARWGATVCRPNERSADLSPGINSGSVGMAETKSRWFNLSSFCNPSSAHHVVGLCSVLFMTKVFVFFFLLLFDTHAQCIQ